MWKLTIVDDEGTKTVLPLSRGEYAIGRDPENTIRLTERNISRKHLFLRRNEGDSWVVEDLSSYNGCFVNGLRVSGSHPLHDGDLLQVGDYRLELLDDEKAEPAVDAQGVPAAPPPVSRLLDRPDRLVVVDGPTAGAEYPLDHDRLILGRAEDADISINHSSVSRIHAEITRITANTYEIVDCGSSNGIRVNGIKLDRRVIEDDDEIELGDVRLRFVGQGRIFRPGPPRFTTSFAPASTAAGLSTGPKRQLGVMIAVGALLGVLCVVGFIALRARNTSTTGTAPSASTEQPAVLTEARRLEAAGDLDGAHAKLNSEISETSALRDNADVQRIEAAWADAQLQKAAGEADVGRKRALLAQVAAARLVDSDRRKRAVDELQRLDTAGPDINAVSVAAAGRDGGTSGPSAGLNPVDAHDKSKPPATSKDTGKPAPPPPTAEPTATGGDTNKVVLDEGEAKARRVLEPRVWSGKATVEEIRMLKAICRHQKDGACVGRCNAMLQERGQ